MYLSMKPELIILFWIMFLLSKKKTFIIYYITTCIENVYMPITRMILPCFWFQSLGLVNNFLSCKHLVDFCKIATIYNKTTFHLSSEGWGPSHNQVSDISYSNDWSCHGNCKMKNNKTIWFVQMYFTFNVQLYPQPVLDEKKS